MDKEKLRSELESLLEGFINLHESVLEQMEPGDEKESVRRDLENQKKEYANYLIKKNNHDNK